MRFYNRQHQYYCGIDLHVKTMYVCILDGTGQVLVHRNVPSTPTFLEVVGPYRTDLVVAAECMFTWYWLADVCAAEGILFVLGHALAMKAIHGGKAKNDKIDSHKIAVLNRCGPVSSTRASSGNEDSTDRERDSGFDSAVALGLPTLGLRTTTGRRRSALLTRGGLIGVSRLPADQLIVVGV
jgi:transposase